MSRPTGHRCRYAARVSAPYEPTAGDPQDRLRKVADQHGSSAAPNGYDAARSTAAYPSAPVQYPGIPGQFEPAGQSAGLPHDPGSYAPPPFSAASYSPPPYGQSPYATPGYPAPFGAPARNGMGTAGLVLGIIGVVVCWTPLGFILGILAIIFGSIGRSRATRGEATNQSSATAGLVLGIVSIALLLLFLIVGASLYSA